MAIVDARSLDDGSTVTADICVIGAGPAGIAIAERFKQTSTRVVLLESGGLDADADTQALAAGEVVGRPYPDLDSARLRLLGGTSNHWGGNIRPLDPIDFTERAWVPHSGWPFGADELAPYYPRAAAFCKVPFDAFDVGKQTELMSASPWDFDGGSIRSQVFQTVGIDSRFFGELYRGDLQDAANVTTYLYANVVDIETDDLMARVERLKARTLTGKSLTVEASFFVLATGGIENPRLLLAANKKQQAGLGNANGLVGRFFMEHLTSPQFGELFPADPQLNLDFYKGRDVNWGHSWGILSFTEEAQRTAGLLNGRFQTATVLNEFNKHFETSDGLKSLKTVASAAGRSRVPDDLGRHVANIIADIDDVAESGYYRAFYYPDYPLVSVDMVMICEQAPNPESRVTLGEPRDALGMARPVLDWRLTELDSQNLRKASAELQRQLGRSGLGRLRIDMPDGAFDEVDPKPHYHHMGTTRMHDDPKKGVVDANCRLHELPNFFVAGSSVFPTVGNVNPTLTIIALAFRLADHLAELKT